jgi:hypothetical protein
VLALITGRAATATEPRARLRHSSIPLMILTL